MRKLLSELSWFPAGNCGARNRYIAFFKVDQRGYTRQRYLFYGPHPARGYYGVTAAAFRSFREDDRDDIGDDDEEKPLGGATIVKGLTDAMAIPFLSSVLDSSLRISDVARLASHVTSLNFYASCIVRK